MVRDPHDNRAFYRYAKTDADGTVIATVEVAVTAPPPADTEDHAFVDVSERKGVNLFTVKMDPLVISARLATVRLAKVAPVPVDVVVPVDVAPSGATE